MVKAYEVENLSKVDTTLYKNGDIFYTKKTAGILLYGKIKPFFSSNTLKKADIQKMIDESIKKAGENNA